jgi:ribonuclease G
MASQILINVNLRETRVARVENDELVEFSVERTRDRSLVGNIYKGRVNRVLPGMQAAFVEVGLPKAGFLYAGNVYDPDAKEDEPIEADTDDEVEAPVAASDEDEAAEGESPEAPAQPIPRPRFRREEDLKNISELVKEGEALLVQVIKEPMGTKGARLTGYISIPGRFLVYLPNSKHLGVSRRVGNSEERDRLKKIVVKHRPAQGGFIVRTVAEGASEKNIKDDLEYLVRTWGGIKKAAEKQKGPGLVQADLDLVAKIIRDRVTDDVERILVDNLDTYKRIQKFVQTFLPRFKKRIEIHDNQRPLFELYGISTEITRSLGRKVWLKSGGYIVIDETEALTTIDVNSGRFVGGRNLEETILQTNMEAVKEIAYQIRLRNLGGIIVLDFIDMMKLGHRDRIYNSLLEDLKKDPVKTNVLPISELGLIEMTRKRTQESLRQKLMTGCSYCDGRGFVKSKETIAYQILRDCLKEARADKASGSVLAVYCHPTIAAFFTEEEREAMDELEKQTGRRLTVKADTALHLEEYEIFGKES